MNAHDSEKVVGTLLAEGYEQVPTPEQAELVLYPGENHHFLGEGAPSVREDAARRIIDWVTRHVATPSPGPADPGTEPGPEGS